MFETFSRSWQFATASYGMLWRNKSLLVFPILSTLAAALVVASFAIPLWATGQLELWADAAQNAENGQNLAGQVGPYIVLFLFYFCNYFVIVFFNAALVSGAMQVLRGEEPSVGQCLSTAGQRIVQIAAWALVSAVVGVILRVLENNRRVGGFVAAILGTAWTVVTFFVVPVIVLEGTGPVEAFKRSLSTLKKTWGTALVGNFSLGILSFLIMLPVYLVGVVLIGLGIASGSLVLAILCGAAGVMVIVLGASAAAAADTIFKALLYSFATGQTVPADIDTSEFDRAFVAKR